MSTQALYLRWRPQRFDEVIGQDHIVRTLLGAIRQGRIRHAYLFNGPRGTGKTTIARLLAKAVNCVNPDISLRPCNECESCISMAAGRFLDIIEIDAASHTGVDDVRDLRERIAFAPSEGRYKVYIIDEVHRFSGAAFDALLKTLEEPPEHAIFVLATTEIHKVPDTIKSRCLMFEFRRVSLREVMDRLREIAETDGVSIDDSALELIARQGTGSVRDSISLLDQIVSDPSEHITYEMAQAMLGAAGNQYVWEVAQAILENDTAYGLNMLNEAIDQGADPRQFGRQMVDHLRRLLLIRMGSPQLVDASDEMRKALKEQADHFSSGMLMRAIRAFNAGVEEMRGGWQPQLPLELALVESTLPSSGETQAASSNSPQRQPPSNNPSQPRPGNTPTPKPASPPSAPAPAKPDKPRATLSFQQFSAQWQDFIAAVSANKPSIEGLLKSCFALRIEGQTLVIGVNNATHRNQLEKGQNFLLSAAHSLFGEGIALRLELVDSQASNSDNNPQLTDEFLTRAQNELGARINFHSNE